MKKDLVKHLAMTSVIVLSTVFTAAHANVIHYEFQADITSGIGPFAVGTTLTATFDYDPTISPISQNVDGGLIGPGLVPFGLFSTYLGAMSNFSASIAGNNFSADANAVLVGDGSGGDPLSGIFAFGSSSAPGWSGFSAGGFTLLSFNLFTVGLNTMLADQSLPSEWPHYQTIAGGLNSGINLTFKDAAGVVTVQNTHGTLGGNVIIRQVPEPGTVGLLGAGLLGIGWLRRRRSR